MMISIRLENLTREQLNEKNITVSQIENLISDFFSINRIDVEFIAEPSRKIGVSNLKKQHIKILYLSARGKTYKDIGNKMNIKEIIVK